MKKILLISLGALAIVACTREMTRIDGDRIPVNFKTNVSTYSVKATESALEEEDAVQIIAAAPIDAASAATVSGGELVLADPIYWNVGQTGSNDFVAIYPGAGQTTTTVDYDLWNNDSYNYAYHSKYLAAKATAAVGEDVELEFKHPFSKILVKITNNLGADAVKSVTVKNVVLGGVLDLAAGTIDLDGKASGDVPGTKVSDTAEDWATIIVPQTATPDIVVETNLGSIYTFKLESAFTFKAGEIATAEVTLVGGSSHSGDEHGAEVAFSFEVSPWAAADAEVTIDDETSTVAVSENYWYIEGTINGTSWGTAYPMVLESAGVWTVDFSYEGATTGVTSPGFKLHKGADSWATQAGSQNGEDAVITLGEEYGAWGTNNGNMQLAANGDYTLTFTEDGYKVTIVAKN